MAVHLPYGGSTAHRTLACPGWVKASENIPKRPAGAAAIEGSMHHEIQEMCRRDGKHPSALIGHVYKEDGQTLKFTEDDLDLAVIAYEATEKLLDEHDIEDMMIEPFVELIPGKVGGSIDLLGVTADGRTILILDYKFGAVKAEVIQSAQHFLYACAAAEDKSTRRMVEDASEVVFAIVQPRIKGVVSTNMYMVEELIAWGEKFIAATKRNDINPGAHCRYCPAEPYCEAKRLRMIGHNILHPELKGKLQQSADILTQVEDWLKSTREEMYLQMNRGVPINGWKIVQKRANREWLDEAKALEALRGSKLPKKDLLVSKLLSPAQVEKLAKKREAKIDLDKLVKSESSGTTLAKADDTRTAVVVSDVQGHLTEMMK